MDGYPRLREDARALDAAARACDAVGRLFETSEPHPGVFNLLCRKLALLDEQAGGADRSASARPTGPPAADPQAVVPSAAARTAAGGRAGALQFRLKLLHAAGLAPQLGACAQCGEPEHLVGFSGAAGGVVCGACEAGSFPLGEDAHGFMVRALSCALADPPDALERTLGQVERAIAETLEHHAHLRLMPAAERSRESSRR
jgi:DNA repair protein RecO (recombination protein O)